MSFIPPWWDASKSRSGRYPMLGLFLLYANIACVDAIDMIGRLDAHEGMSEAVKVETVE